jgi:hypothetical protein
MGVQGGGGRGREGPRDGDPDTASLRSRSLLDSPTGVPDPVKCRIASFLSARDALSLSSACKSVRITASRQFVWRFPYFVCFIL